MKCALQALPHGLRAGSVPILDENEEDIDDNSSEGWETEDDDGEEEEKDEENDDSFEDSDIEVSDNEVLYDKDGNVIAEEDIGEGLKEIMERHMRRQRWDRAGRVGFGGMTRPAR